MFEFALGLVVGVAGTAWYFRAHEGDDVYFCTEQHRKGCILPIEGSRVKLDGRSGVIWTSIHDRVTVKFNDHHIQTLKASDFWQRVEMYNNKKVLYGSI